MSLTVTTNIKIIKPLDFISTEDYRKRQKDEQREQWIITIFGFLVWIINEYIHHMLSWNYTVTTSHIYIWKDEQSKNFKCTTVSSSTLYTNWIKENPKYQYTYKFFKQFHKIMIKEMLTLTTPNFLIFSSFALFNTGFWDNHPPIYTLSKLVFAFGATVISLCLKA